MIRNIFLSTVLALTSVASYGAAASDKTYALCNAVGDGTEEDLDSSNRYIYQSIILQAADVSPSDSAEDAKTKIAKLWRRKVKDIFCANTGFRGGSLIEYAFYRRIDDFIDDVTRVWALPPDVLDTINRKTGQTAKDFADDELVTASSPVVAQRIELMRGKLMAAGAKNRLELDGIECRQEGGFKPDARCGK